MKKLMVLGASEFQIPLLKQAHDMGVCTYVLDINPDSRGVKYADYYYQCSLKDVDKALSIAGMIEPDGVTVGMCDVAVCTAAAICEKLHLPGIDLSAAVRSTDKFLMIEEFKKAGVPHPEYRLIQKDNIADFCNSFTFPVISKPVDMAGSRGINKIENAGMLLEALYDSSDKGDTGDIIVEEYMDGPEVSVEIIVYGNTPHVLQITDKYTSGAPHFMEIGHSQPSLLENRIQEKIKEVATKAALALGLRNCFAHAEIIITQDGPKMVEIGARMGGDGIQEQLMMLSTGINIPYYAVKFALGEDFELPVAALNRCSAIKFIQSKEGIIQSVNGVENAMQIEGIKQIEILNGPGAVIEKPKDNSGRLGYIISQADSVKEAIMACEKASEIIKFDIVRNG